MALVAAERFMSAMQGSVFELAGRQALAKLKHALAPEIRTRLEALTRHVTTTPAPLRKLTKQRPYLEKLLTALEREEVVVVEYQKLSAAQPERYTVEPHSLNMQGSSVHVVVWARERNAARVFLLDRVTSVTPTGERFVPRAELGPGAFDQGAFGLWNAPAVRIRLRFKGSAARIVAEQQFHPTQQVHWNDDGSLAFELVAPPSPALRAWVRGFGKRVEILEPKNLVEEP